MAIMFKTAYGPKPNYPIFFTGEGRTKQAFKAETDINNIMARYQKTGVLDFAQKREAQYGDTTGIDFRSCMETVANANSMFAELPSSLRNRFDNDPAKFLDFVQDDNNLAEARKLGLLKPEAREATPPATPQAATQPAAAHAHVKDATTQNRDSDGRFETGHEHKNA